MLEFLDRVPATGKANMVFIEHSNGSKEQVKITPADDAVEVGTPISRANLMAMQGFIANNTVFNADGSVTETNAKGEVLTTIFNDDGSITETFVGEKTITKTTTFNADGSISEVIS